MERRMDLDLAVCLRLEKQVRLTIRKTDGLWVIRDIIRPVCGLVMICRKSWIN